MAGIKRVVAKAAKTGVKAGQKNDKMWKAIEGGASAKKTAGVAKSAAKAGVKAGRTNTKMWNKLESDKKPFKPTKDFKGI
jgi:hypothetical protein